MCRNKSHEFNIQTVKMPYRVTFNKSLQIIWTSGASMIRGGSRILRSWGRQPFGRGGGRQHVYNFSKFSQKLHEVQKMFGRRWQLWTRRANKFGAVIFSLVPSKGGLVESCVLTRFILSFHCLTSTKACVIDYNDTLQFPFIFFRVTRPFKECTSPL